MRINHNISSLNTQGSLFRVNQSMSKSLAKLSTGMRINGAADDAAGLGVSEQLRTQVRGMSQALRNTQDAISMLNIADGALQEQAEILQRMRELVIQAKNDTYADTERAYMYQEFAGLMEALDQIAQVTNFNGMQLFATPEALGAGVTTQNLYTTDNPNGIDTNGFKTNHATNDARDVWTDDSKSLFGENDVSSAHHFNMMIGANYGSADTAAWDAATASYGDRGAENMLTIQFGQMDANALLTIYPGGDVDPMFVGTARELWDNFEFHAYDSGGNYDDWEDAALAEAAFPNYDAINTGQKLNLLLKVIDGDGAAFTSDYKTAFGNGQPDGANVTGLERVNRMRSSIGAMINRLEHTVNNTMNQINNTQAAESLIRDADFAAETAAFTRNQILSQSATAMLAQSNQTTQGVLQLLR